MRKRFGPRSLVSGLLDLTLSTSPGARVTPAGGVGIPAGERRWLLALLIACACLDVYRLGGPSLFDQDETEYAEIAVEMVHGGDPLTLHVNFQPWYVHPPLFMWLVAATGGVFGFTPFTVRIWSMLFSLLAVYATVLLGRLLFGGRTGLLAGAILGTSLQYLVQARLAVFDTVLLAWVLLAFYAFLMGYRTGRREHYLRFFMFAGLATLTKGPIGIILPGLVIAAFVIARRAWGIWRDVPWAAGLALYAVIGLWWYGAMILLHGRAFIAANVGYYTVGRYFGVVEKHDGPWFFYIPVLLAGALPWSTFWPPAAAWHARRRSEDGSVIVLLGVLVPFLFYSLARTKLPGYALPIYPFAAIGVAALWAPLLSGGTVNRPVRAALSALVLLTVAFLAIAAAFLHQRFPSAYPAGASFLALPAGVLAAGVLGVALMSPRARALPVFLALWMTVAASWLTLLAVTPMPLVESQKPVRTLALALKPALRPGDRIVGYRMDILTSLIYYTGYPVEWVEDPGKLRAALCAPGRAFIVITDNELAVLPWSTAGLSPFAHALDTFVLLKPASMRCPLRVPTLP
jgi:4-amino-4-deoxy-L-arabinose transferase-like glycosyltransferase